MIAVVMICGLTACGGTGNKKESGTSGNVTQGSENQNSTQNGGWSTGQNETGGQDVQADSDVKKDDEQGDGLDDDKESGQDDVQDAGEDEESKQGTGAPAATDYAFSSTDWKTLEFALDGVIYTFPMTWADVEAAGYQLEDEYRHEVLGSYEYTTSFTAESESGERFNVRFKNFEEGERELQDCYVYGFGFEQSQWRDVNPEVTLCNGVTFGMTVEEVKAIMGEPDYYYESDDPDYDRKAMNYYVTGSSLGSELEFSFHDGILDEITIRNKD